LFQKPVKGKKISQLGDATSCKLSSRRKASLPSFLPEDKGSDSEEYLVASKVKPRKVTNKSSPSKETSTRRPKKAKTSPTKSSKPPPTNPYTWPASKIPEDATIVKGHAKEQYRLRADSDFDGMKCESVPTKVGYIALVYRTRDVEKSGGFPVLVCRQTSLIHTSRALPIAHRSR